MEACGLHVYHEEVHSFPGLLVFELTWEQGYKEASYIGYVHAGPDTLVHITLLCITW